MLIYSSVHKKKDIVVIFIGQDFHDDYYSEDMIASEYMKVHRPDAVIVVYPGYLSEQISNRLNDEVFVAQIARFGPSVSIYKAEFNGSGDVSFSIVRKGKLGQSLFSGEKKASELSVFIVNEGLSYLLNKSKDSLVVNAPSSAVFQKPSGELHRDFIKASEVFSSYFEAQFVAFCLLRLVGGRNWNRLYIDTMSISILADAFIEYLSFFHGNGRRCSYHSFGSYLAFDRGSPRGALDALYIISASTSGNMAKRIVSDWSVDERNIVHVVYCGNKSNFRSLIHDPDILSSSHISDLNDCERRVKLVGENFYAEVGDPKFVLLGTDVPPLLSITAL